nr:nucleolar protein 8 [Nerophis lumbriciformis]
MPRLYVGGLTHLVTQKDLTDRFGKFGQVEDVELRTRKDDEGVPYKTFAYINLNISDTDLKKCMTVLNKSKWKGGTLQIEPAKESFLHKLAQERETEQRRQCQHADDKQQNVNKLLEAFSKAGVNNFTMKAAVPGTEVPGHKDWVVSKFGRVLPVMQLRCKKGSKARTLKYDPSKYSHNIRRLTPPVTAPDAADPPTPVDKLTWQIEGGDNEISKKRRGEFAPYKSTRPKKTCAEVLELLNSARPAKSENHHLTNGFSVVSDKHPIQNRRYEDSDVDSDEEIHRLAALERLSYNAPGRDMEEDNLEVVGDDYFLKAGVSHKKIYGIPKHNRDDEDYDSADTDELFASRKRSPPPPLEDMSGKKGKRERGRKDDARVNGISVFSGEQEEEDYQSADTDELFTPRKCPLLPLENISRDKEKTRKEEDNSTGMKKISTPGKPSPPRPNKISGESMGTKKRKRKEEDQRTKKSVVSEKADEEDNSSDIHKISTHKKSSLLPPKIPGQNEKKNIKEDKSTTKTAFISKEEEEADDEEEEDDKSDYSADSEYEAMFSNVTHLEISLSDLQKLAGETQPTSEEPPPRRTFKKGILPEEILASLLRDDGDEYERESEKKKRKTTLPPFRGTAMLYQEEELNAESSRVEEEVKVTCRDEKEEERQRKDNTMRLASFQEEVMEREGHEKKEENVGSSSSGEEEEVNVKCRPKLSTQYEKDWKKKDKTTRLASFQEEEVMEREAQEKTEVNVESSSSGEEAGEKVTCRPKLNAMEGKDRQKKGKTARLPSFQEEVIDREAQEKKEENVESSSSSSEEEVKDTCRPKLSAQEEEERQKKDNTRRLAAVQQRLKETQRHKELIQGALANVDAGRAKTGKHIVFDSDDNEEEETSPLLDGQLEDSHEESATNKSVPSINEHGSKMSGPQLFDSSGEDDKEEDDGGGFHVRPQFEGRAGQKLMALQSRFGTDERFRMDSRFLEEEEMDQESDGKANVAEDEEALQEEKKRNMSILQGLLGHQANSAKTSTKTKTFRDVSALHYDPSREEHAAFETKAVSSKESKSTRRKKREEAQKLPEVSKEIFYDVSGDLKAMFGSVTDQQPAEAVEIAWDQNQDEEKEEEEEQPQGEEPSGFMFSFFGDDIQTASKPEEYKIESIHTAKVSSWQQDPRLQDSSEEDEEEEEDEVQKEKNNTPPKNQRDEIAPAMNEFFFFHLDDSRLTEGPKWFCRSSQLEDERDEWEERRTELRQEYRKKHRDARRKLRSSQKT